MTHSKTAILKDLRTIPGVGKAIAEDLWDLGIRQPGDLKNANPRELYDQLCDLRQMPIDRCMLYVFRCAVYFASTPHPQPELLKWWHWKDS